MKHLGRLYLTTPALYERDFEEGGFQWLDCKDGDCTYSFLRRGARQTVLAVFNFGKDPVKDYVVPVEGSRRAIPLVDSGWERFGGTLPETSAPLPIKSGGLLLDLEPFSGKLFRLAR